MVKISLFALSLVSISALACPNLKGSWNCSMAGGPSQMITIDQREVEAATAYEITGSGSPQVLITDGKDHNLTDNAHGATMVSNASCIGDVGLMGKATVHATNPPVNMSGSFNYQLANPTTMTATADITYTVNGQTGHGVQTLNCTRN